jgi:hypothetical protein
VETGTAHTEGTFAPAADKDLTESTDPGGHPVLQVAGLDASYGRDQVLFGIDLTVPPDTLRCDRRWVRLRQDHARALHSRPAHELDREVRYAGRPLPPGVHRRPKEVLRGIQYVFQNPCASLNPRHTGGGLIARRDYSYHSWGPSLTDSAQCRSCVTIRVA